MSTLGDNRISMVIQTAAGTQLDEDRDLMLGAARFLRALASSPADSAEDAAGMATWAQWLEDYADDCEATGEVGRTISTGVPPGMRQCAALLRQSSAAVAEAVRVAVASERETARTTCDAYRVALEALVEATKDLIFKDPSKSKAFGGLEAKLRTALELARVAMRSDRMSQCADSLNFGEPQPDCGRCGGTGVMKARADGGEGKNR